MAANIYHAKEQLVKVSLRQLSAKSDNCCHTKWPAKETLRMDDPRWSLKEFNANVSHSILEELRGKKCKQNEALKH